MRIASLKGIRFNQYVSVSKKTGPLKTIECPKISLREHYGMPFLEKKLGHHHPMKPAANRLEGEETRDWRFREEDLVEKSFTCCICKTVDHRFVAEGW